MKLQIIIAILLLQTTKVNGQNYHLIWGDTSKMDFTFFSFEEVWFLKKPIRDGTYFFYFKEDTTKLKKQVQYINGHKIGYEYEWYINNQIKSQNFYNQNGQLDGAIQDWFSNGKKRYEAHYKNDTLNGKSREWFESGVLKMETEFRNGKIDGKSTFWHYNKKINRIVYYSKNKRIKRETYSLKGKLIKVDLYQDNE